MWQLLLVLPHSTHNFLAWELVYVLLGGYEDATYLDSWYTDHIHTQYPYTIDVGVQAPTAEVHVVLEVPPEVDEGMFN